MKNDGSRLYKPREFNAITRQRFFRDRRAGLLKHLGQAPSRPQLVLCERIIRNEWDLLRLDSVMDERELSPHAMRVRLAMENRLRLDLQALGLAPTAPRQQSLDDVLREITPSNEGRAA